MDVSCECKCRFHGRKWNTDQCLDNNKCVCECKKRHVHEKYYSWNPATCSWENGKYLASIIDNSKVMCDEVVESYNEEKNFNEKKATCETQNFYILLAFLSITKSLLIAVSICCYYIKYQEIEKIYYPYTSQIAN